MSDLDKTVKCRICGKPYKFYAFMVGDQSACPSCVEEGEQAINRPSSPKEKQRRKDYWNN